jgi:hypothetical protein
MQVLRSSAESTAASSAIHRPGTSRDCAKTSAAPPKDNLANRRAPLVNSNVPAKEATAERVIDPRAWRAALAVFAVAFAIYLPKTVNHFGYTFDDGPYILQNTYLRSWHGAIGEFGRDQARIYRPLRSLALAAVTGVFGQDHALPFHLVGMLFHAACSAAATLIVWLLVADPRAACRVRNSQFAIEAALVAGLIFALHPVHSDRAANIMGSFDLFGMALGLTAWLLALTSVRAPGVRVNRQPSAPSTVNRQPSTSVLAWGAALAMLLGCFASEEALMILPLAALSLWLPFPSQFASRNSRWPRIRAILLLAVAGFAYFAVRTHILGGVARHATYSAGSLANTFWTMPIVVWRYIGLLFFPVGLSMAYGPTIHTHADLANVAAMLGLIGLVAVALAAVRRAPVAAMAIGWFFIGLAPFSNLLPNDAMMAERFLYAGLGGFALAGGVAFAAWRNVYRERPRAETQRRGVSGTDHRPDRSPSTVNRQLAATSIVLAAILVLYGVGVISRCRVWGDPTRLWAEAAIREPHSFLAVNQAAMEMLMVHRTRDAERFAQEANQLDARRPEPLLNMAVIAFADRHPNEGMRFLQSALRTAPWFCYAYDVLALRLMFDNDSAGATQAAAAAARCHPPGDPSKAYVTAFLLVSAGLCDQAAPHIEAVLATQPRPPEYSVTMALRDRCRQQMTAITYGAER